MFSLFGFRPKQPWKTHLLAGSKAALRDTKIWSHLILTQCQCTHLLEAQIHRQVHLRIPWNQSHLRQGAGFLAEAQGRSRVFLQ